MKIIFGLVGLKAAELHGNLTQIQRFDALENFRDGKVDFLLATDVASRGIDIIGIKTIINYALPPNQASYVHRVGRTARAGAGGRAVSIITDSSADRKLLKQIAKQTEKGHSVKNRVIPHDAIIEWRKKVEALKIDVDDVHSQEKEETMMRLADRDATRVENTIIHAAEIKARPRRTWFMTDEEKKDLKAKTKAIDTGIDPEAAQGGDDCQTCHDHDHGHGHGHGHDHGHGHSHQKKNGKTSSKKKGDEVEIRPGSSIPVIKTKTRREKVKEVEKDRMLSPGKYQLARKKNTIQAAEKKANRQMAPGGTRNPPRPKKKQKVEQKPKEEFGRGIKPKKAGGKFKSKKKHKRR